MSFHTQRLYLRRMMKDDFVFFITLINDPEIIKYFGSFRNLSDPKKEFSEMILNKQDHGNLFLTICTNSNIPIGIMNFFGCPNGQWLVEYALLKQYRRNGYVSELLTQICQNDFEFLTVFKTNKTLIHSLLFEVRADNIVAQKFLIKIARNLNTELYREGIWYTIIL